MKLWLLDPFSLDEPVVDGLESHHLRAAKLDDLAQQLRLADGLDHAPGRVLAEDRLELGLAVSRDDEDRAEFDKSLEIVEEAAFLGDDEGEAEDGARDTGLRELLLTHPSGGQVFVVLVKTSTDDADH